MNKEFNGVKQYPKEYTQEDMIRYSNYVHKECLNAAADSHVFENNDLFMSWLKEHKIEKWIEMTRNFKIEQILK